MYVLVRAMECSIEQPDIMIHLSNPRAELISQGGCCGGGVSRARFSNQPGGEALPTEEELSALEMDPLQEPDTLAGGARGDHRSTMDEETQGSAESARVEDMSEANP